MKKVTDEILQGRILSIGLGTNLQFQVGSKGQEFKAAGALVGMISDEYLMVRVPAIPGILNRLNEGEPVTIRYVYAGNVYGFTSRVAAFVQKPALIAFIDYPVSVESMNLRKARRMECLFPAKITAEEIEHKGVILDISLGGCRIWIDNETGVSPAIDVGRTVGIRFLLTGMTEDQVIDCKIQNIKKDDRHVEMGLQFDRENLTVINNVKLYMDRFAKLWFLPVVKASSEKGRHRVGGVASVLA